MTKKKSLVFSICKFTNCGAGGVTYGFLQQDT